MVCDQLTAGLVRIGAVVVGRLGKAAVRLVTVRMCEGQEATTGTVHLVFWTGSPMSLKLSSKPGCQLI